MADPVGISIWSQKTRMTALSGCGRISTICLAVWVQYQRVADGRAELPYRQYRAMHGRSVKVITNLVK